IRAEMLLKLHPDRLAEALSEIDAALALDRSYEMAVNLRRRIVAAMGPAAPSAANAAPPSSPGAPALDARTTETILAGLREAPAGSPVWIAARADDPGVT